MRSFLFERTGCRVFGGLLALAVLSSLVGCGGSGGGGGGGAATTGTLVGGSVTLGGSPATPAGLPAAGVEGTTVEAVDADGDVIASTTTDANGDYTLRLPDGNFELGIRVGTTDYFIPLREAVIVQGTSVQGTTTVGGTPTLDFEVPAPLETLTGQVNAGMTGASGVVVEFVDVETGLARFQETTAANGSFSVTTLPIGRFSVQVDSSSVPSGFAVPTPQIVAVTDSGISPASVTITLATAVVTSGTITSTSGLAPVAGLSPQGGLQPAFLPEAPLTVNPGAEVVVFETGFGEVARFPITDDGDFDLNLRDGSYTLVFQGLGADVVAPPPTRIIVQNGLVYTDESDTAFDPTMASLSPTAAEVSATLTGSVTRGGTAVRTRVLAVDPTTGGVLASADTTAAGAYSLPLADGSYDITIPSNLLPPGLVPPLPVRVAVEAAASPGAPFLEAAGTANDGVVDFALAATNVALSGVVRDSMANPVADVRVRALKGSEVIARAVSDSSGAYTLRLPLGTIDIAVNRDTVPTGLLAPEPTRVEVALAGANPVITGPTGVLTSLDITFTSRAPNVTGAVTFDFNGNSTVEASEFVGCRVIAWDPSEQRVLFDTPTNPTNGEYALTLPDGTYVVGLDPQSLPPGSAAPPRQQISVATGGVSTADGNTNATATIDFQLVRRAATLTGVVSINARGTSIALDLVDSSAGVLVSKVRSEALSGAYRMPLFPGAYELRVDAETLPAGTALPNPIPLSVATNGTISTTTGNITTLDIALTRVVAELTGTITVSRSGDDLPLDVQLVVRDPQSLAILQTVRTDAATGSYLLRLLPGSKRIGIDPSSIPPGVQPAIPVQVLVTGTTVTGDGVASNTLDFSLQDIRSAGVDITGTVFDNTSGNGIPAQVVLFDPASGSDQNFILSVPTDANGDFALRVVDGTYELAVLPQSLPPTAIRPSNVTFSVQGMNIIESNSTLVGGMGVNAANDGTINFRIRDGASSGFTVTGTVLDGMNPIPGVRVRVRDAATESILASQVTDPVSGGFNFVLPLGSYLLGIDPTSLPFTYLVPPRKSILAVDNAGIQVTTNNGVVVMANMAGAYPFLFTPTAASQTLTGTVLDPSSNGLRVFVRVRDATSDEFVLGRWTDDVAGTFQALLAPGTYLVDVDPGSTPLGVVTPAPLSVTVTSTSILENSGTSNDGDLAFQLLTANRNVSGTVVTDGANPVACFVVVENAQTGAFVNGRPTAPATGNYQMIVPPGIYRVRVDAPSLPPGFTPPAEATVDATSSNPVADFTVSVASQCLSGNVLTDANLLPLTAFVRLENASTGQFVAGVPTEPDGSYELCAGPGSYELRVDPNSLPAGTITPTPVTVQITAATILENDATGAMNAANDGTVNFRVSEEAVANLAQLDGTITLTVAGATTPLGVFLFAEDAGTGQFVNGTFSSPVDGTYSLPLAAGSYRLFLEPGSLPPGLALPPPRLFTVAADDTITVQIEGVPVVTNTIDFVLQAAQNSVTGTVSLSGAGFPCFVQLVDPTNTDLVFFGVPTAANGTYSMLVPNGSYRLRVDRFSLPPGIVAPAGVNLTASTGFVSESQGTANDGVVNFTLSQSGATLQGYVVDDQNANVANDTDNRMFAFVKAFDVTNGFVAAQAPTAPGSYFNLPLGNGTYDILVDPPSLPLDVVPPVPTRVTVSGSTVTITSAGDGQLDPNSRLRITATRISVAATVNVIVDDGSGNDIPANVRVRDSAGNTLFVLFVPPTGAGANILLGDGSFTLSVLPGSTPPGLTIPDPTAVTVSGGTAMPAMVTISLTATSLSGTIYNAVSMGSLLVALDLLDGAGNVVSPNLPLMISGSDATYAADLGEGSYALRLRRATGVDSTEVLLPENTPITVTGGVIQNPDADPMLAGVQIDVFIPAIAATISGTVEVASAPLAGVPVILVNTFNNRIANRATTDMNGDYELAVPAGFYALLPEPEGLSLLAPDAIPAPPYEVQISPAGDISVVGQPGLCAAGGPNEACTGVDFSMVVFNPATDAQITGTVQSRPNAATPLAPIEGAVVLLLNNDFTPLAATTTDAAGEYTLFATSGLYRISVDPFQAEIGYPIVPLPDVLVSVDGTDVAETNVAGTGNVADDGIVNFNFSGASGLVHGRVQTASGQGVGAFLVVTNSTVTEFPTNFTYGVPTSPNGDYFLPIGEGSFKLWVDPNSVPPGYVAPQPSNFSVLGATVTEANTAGSNNVANDGTINPVVLSGGISIYAQVLDSAGNPAAAFVALLQAAPNPNDPPFFVAGAPTQPATGNVNLAAASGSYFLEVDPGSVPPDAQTPARVNVTVAGGAVSFAAGTETAMVGANTHAVLRLTSATTGVTGSVRNGMGNPVPTFVFAVDASTGAFIKDAPVQPSTGRYSMTLGNGVYDLIVDPFNLPPGVLAPSPVRVSVNGATVSEDNDVGVDPADGMTANMDDDGIVNFVVGSASATLTGYVRNPAGQGVFANVGLFAADSSGEYSVFVAGFPSDFTTGFFEVPVGTGTYLVTIDPFSLPPGLIAPVGVQISVTGATVTFPPSATVEVEMMVNRLILELEAAGSGVTGTVLNSAGNPVPVFVIAENATTHQFMGGAPTDANGDYVIGLPPGTYRVFVDPPSLPLGSVPPAPLTVSVSSSLTADVDFTISTAGATFTGNVLLRGPNWSDGVTTADCSNIPASVTADEAYPVSCAVVLLAPSQNPNNPPTFLAQTFSSPGTGFFSLPVGSGTYQVAIDGSTLPPGAIPPPPLTLTVSGSTITLSGSSDACSNNAAQKLILLSNSLLAIDGLVRDASDNPVGCFIEVIDANTGNFVTGTPNNPSDGSFSLPLGELTYQLRVDPFSVPAGLIAPPPVTISTTGGTISVSTVTGTSYSGGVLTITLDSASGAVSGTTTDADSNPLSVFVQAFTSAGDPVASSWSSPTDGAYSLALAPGIYEIAVEPFSLPPGFAPPATRVANLIEQSSATIDFEIETAPGTITGSIYFDSMGTPTGLPGFVEIVNATTGAFVTGSPSQPQANGEFTYTLNVGEGSYRIGVDPGSVPPGYVVPAPTAFTVNVNAISGEASITESNTTGTGNAANDGEINFLLTTAGATLNGRVVYDNMGTPTGLTAFVRVEQADGSGALVAEAATNGSGNFTLALGDGSYLLRVDPGSLPPGFLPPPALSMSVSGTSVTIAGTVVMGTYSLQVIQSGAQLTGTVTRASNSAAIQGAFLAVIDAATNGFVAGSSTAANGSYAIALGNGTYRVELDPFTLPNGLIPPAPTQIVVSGATISVGGSPIANLDIAVSGAAATVTIDVRDSQGAPMWVPVEVRDQATDSPIASPFVSGAPVEVGLPVGTYFVLVPTFGLPPGTSPPAPVSLVVSGNGTTQDSSGNPSDGLITLTIQQAAAIIGGTVTFDGMPASGVQVGATELGSGLLIANSFTNAQGMYALSLPTGEFDIAPVAGLPANAVPPAALLARVFGPGNVDPAGPYDFTVVSAAGSVSGTVTLDGVGVPATVLALVDTMGIFAPVASVETQVDGSFTLALAEDTFVVIAEIDVAALDPMPAAVIAPLPFDADVDTMATTTFNHDFDFFTPGAMGAPASQTLRGSITAGGAPFEAPILLAYQGKPMVRAEAVGGDYELAIMADSQRMFEVGLFAPELPTGYMAPTPVTITVDGSGIVGTGVTPDSGDFVLDFEVDVDGRALVGTVRDDSMNPLSGVEIVTLLANGNPGPVTTTDASGDYGMILPEGSYEVALGGGLPLGMVRPAAVAVAVTDNAGTLELTINGAPSVGGVLDWTVQTAHARLSGSVTSGMAPLPARIVAYSGGVEVTSVVSPGGTYELYLPVGSFSINAVPTLPVGQAVYALPFALTVTDTGALAQVSHDFAFDPVTAMHPGQTVQGSVLVDDMGYATELQVATTAGALVATLATDPAGQWSITLPPGTYRLTLLDADLPNNIVGPIRTDFEVTADALTGPAIRDGFLTIALFTTGFTVSGNVTLGANPVVGTYLFFTRSNDMPGKGGAGGSASAWAVTNDAGGYAVLLPEATYELELAVDTLPPDVVLPIFDDFEVADSDLVLDIALTAAAATISGSVTVAGSPAMAEVIAENAAGVEISSALTAADGTYALALPTGTFTLFPELADQSDLQSVATPDPVAVTVVSGMDQTGVDFAYLNAGGMVSTTFTVRVLLGGVPTQAEVHIRKLIGGNPLTFAFLSSPFGIPGGLSIALTDGAYTVQLLSASGVEFMNATPIAIQVAAGTVSSTGSPLPQNTLDITIDGGTLTGTLRDADGLPFQGANLQLLEIGGNAPLGMGMPSDPDGNFMLSGFSEGTYFLSVSTMGLSPGIAPPRLVPVHITMNGIGVSPPSVRLGLADAAGTLSGNVTIDGAGASGRVYAFDTGLRPVAVTMADGAGAFQLQLPAGTYTLLAQPDNVGNAVAPVLSAVTFMGNATQDIAFSSAAMSATLSGSVEVDGDPAEIPVLIYKAGDPPVPVALASPSPAGLYSVRLPVDTLEVVLAPWALPNALVAAEPASITVTSGNVAGTDPNGAAIANNTLDLDPYAASVFGEVRAVVGEVFAAITDGDATALAALLHGDTLWSGETRTQILANWPLRTNWGDPGVRYDHLIAAVTMNSANEYEVWIEQGRNLELATSDDTPIEFWWDARDSGNPAYRFVVKRDDDQSPWLMNGNQLHVADLWLEYATTSTEVGGMTTTGDRVEFGVEQRSTAPLASASVAGTGITDGTLTEDAPEWLAFVDSMTAGPSPFAAVLANLADGGSYGFTATTMAGPADMVDLTLNAPAALLFPNVTLTQTQGTDLLIAWGDISTRLDRAFSELCLELIEDPSGNPNSILESCGLPAGSSWVDVDGSQLMSGSTYELTLEYADVGGGIQTKVIEFGWPLTAGAIISGHVTDGNAPIVGAMIDVRDASTGSPIAMTTTETLGAYTVFLAPGNYTLQLTGLAPGLLPPPEVSLLIVDDMGSIAITVDGTPSMTGVIDWVVQAAVAQLTGQLLVDGMPGTGEIVAYVDGTFFTTVGASAGTYQLQLPAGEVVVFARPTGMTSHLVTPLPYTNTLTNTGSLQMLMHDFEYAPPSMMNPGQMLSGFVYSNGLPFGCDVEITSASGTLVANVPTSLMGNWELTLSPGTYGVAVSTATLPMGFTGLSSTTVVVTASDVTGPGVNQGTLTFVLNTMGTTVSGTVTHGMAGVADVILHFDPAVPMQPTAFVVTDANGMYSLVLTQGAYEVELDSSTLPSGVVLPILPDANVSGPSMTYDIALTTAAASASGSVTIDGSPAQAEIIALDDNGDEVAFAFTDANGDYAMPLPAGAFTLFAELETPDPIGLILPDPASVTITLGNDVANLDFDFVTVMGGNAQILKVRLLAAGQPVAGTVQITKVLGGSDVFFAELPTSFDGAQESARIALSDGTYHVLVIEANMQPVMLSAVEVVVGGGAINVGGQPLANNDLGIDLPQPLSGHVIFNGSAVAAATMWAVPKAGGMATTSLTDGGGEFQFTTLPDGDYYLTISPMSLPSGAALPRVQTLTVSGPQMRPSSVALCLMDKAGDLTGQVTVDAAGAPARVFIFDTALRLVSFVDTDMSGNYVAPLASGVYSVTAVLASPVGTESVALGSAISFSGNATRDLAFTTGTGTLLSGNFTIGGTGTATPLLVYAAGPPAVVHQLVVPSGSGAYAVQLPDGGFEVLPWLERLEVGDVAFAPVAISVASSTVTGNDMDGAAIASNTLNLDPYAATDAGAVRSVAGSFLAAISAGDTPTFAGLLDDVGTVFNGLDKTAWVLDWSSESSWGIQQFDQAVVVLTPVGSDEWQCQIERLRFSEVTSSGAATESFFDQRFSGSTETTFTVRRASGSDPWRIAGNGNDYGEAAIEHELCNVFDGMSDTTEEQAEFVVSEEGQTLASAAVAGTGISDGTLGAMVTPDGTEWSAFVNAMASGPSPFSATLASLVDGGTYSFTVGFTAAPTAMFDRLHHAPVMGLFPTAELTTIGTNSILSWEDVSTRLARPYLFTEVEVIHETMMGPMTMFEDADIPLGILCLDIDTGFFLPGDVYRFRVSVFDAGGAVQSYERVMTWPSP
ncbi:MAG: carboxypeptidase regulatory-like domain-containing protein [Planctomycetota bacterium]